VANSLPIYVLPDGQRVYSSVHLSTALAVRHDNLRRNIHRVFDCWPSQAGGFVAGMYRDSCNRRRPLYWISAAGLCALVGMSVGRPACLLRAQVDGWCRRLAHGELPVLVLTAPLNQAKPVQAAPTASSEAYEFISWLVRSYGRDAVAEETDYAA
jgi:hypothetical protein